MSSIVTLAMAYNPGISYSIVGSITLPVRIAIVAEVIIEWAISGTSALRGFFIVIAISLVAVSGIGICMQVPTLGEIWMKRRGN